ncbi:GNAT family N-acetyltransferase [Luteolibacter flavescens]|uniref:GNAT family N-acetyltransferase n=1 Tax=Luteolibacter flavescens TaxID=1859460 RepID=A0ABT3FUY6_9BACT|nr:GNAT family N-acetyltransferase [Luteolibacter flavescens]MCW1887372.1 GNAT family N-acetyltransferase [Luteolibacter flavescens]
MTPAINIIPATEAHAGAVWRIFREVIAAGDAYVFEADTTYEAFLAYWFAARAYVAMEGAEVLGSYIIKPNLPGRASHVANASYMVAAAARGKGVGGLMCAHSLREAKSQGFRAMQFNIVVSTNVTAVALWQKHGFAIIGTVPGAFRHETLGYVDAHVMFRDLADIGDGSAQ